MAYVNGILSHSIKLPDGSEVSSYHEAEEKMKASGIAFKEDYSDDFYHQKRLDNEKRERDENFSLFIFNYKRSIWI